MFQRIFKQLKPNGMLVLESQPFNTYKKRSKLSEDILKNYKSIKLKPEDFEKYLLSDEVGFTETFCMMDKEVLKNSHLPKGFQRPLQVFLKK
jgi:7SK snRNA methylphosphate capping enzyme